MLIELQTVAPPDNLSIYDTKTLLKELEIYTDWYVSFKIGKPLSDALENEFLNLWEEIFKKLLAAPACLVLHDYHVENIMLLDRVRTNALGLLDFQDQ